MKKHVILLLSLFGMLMIGVPVSAKEKVVVIPMLANKSMNNIVTVAKSGGDFTDLQKAIDSITDASLENPYLIVIAPGRYRVEQTITMKPWVSITGSGQKVTTLWGNIGSSSIDTAAIIQGASDVELSNISIANLGLTSSLNYAAGLYCSDVKNVFLKNVSVLILPGPQPAANITAVYNLDESYLRLTDVDARAIGGGATALYNSTNSISHVNNSVLWGDGKGASIGDSLTRIVNSIIQGGVTSGSASQCRNTYNLELHPVSC
ncbi:MAG: hypothetical protein CSA34_06850 [Desulfobulbus propionicus]|nr:MAG: hypothetical protein CSA34_06850 [Desulfobulbus propionicus]